MKAMMAKVMKGVKTIDVGFKEMKSYLSTMNYLSTTFNQQKNGTLPRDSAEFDKLWNLSSQHHEK